MPQPDVGEPVRMRTADHLTLSFRCGDHDDELPLTWGQQRVARLQSRMRPGHAALNLSWAQALRADVGLDEVAAAMTRAVGACESLRTVVHGDASPPFQRVLAAGTVSVPVVEVPGATFADAVAVADEAAGRPFDGEPAFRPGIVTVEGRPRFLVVAMDHAACDYFGAGWVQWHLRDVLDRGFGSAYRTEGEPGQPRDIVRWEASDGGQKAAARAVVGHAATYASVPASMLPRLPVEPRSPRWRYLDLTSPSLAASVGHVSAAHGVSETSVVHTALSLVLGRVSGLSWASWQVCVSNRVDRGLASAVAPLTQDVPTCLDLTEQSLSAVLRRSAGLLLRATVRGRFPDDERVRVRADVERARGVAIDDSFWLNSRIGQPPAGHPLPVVEELDALRARTTVCEAGGDASSTSTLFVYLDRVEDGALRLRVLFDTAYADVDELATWLRAVETVAHTAATTAVDDTETLLDSTGLRGPDHDAQWVLVDRSWVHLPTALERLRAATGSADAQLHVEASDPVRLVGVVNASDAPAHDWSAALTVDAVRGHKVAMLPSVIRDTAGRTWWTRPESTDPAPAARRH